MKPGNSRGGRRIAVFLGAGASAEFGYPLTREILPAIVERMRRRKLFNGDRTARRSFGRFLEAVLPGIAGIPAKDYPLITEVLSLVDYSLTEDVSLHPHRTVEDVRHFRRLLERAVYEAITLWAESGASSRPADRGQSAVSPRLPPAAGQLDSFITWLAGPSCEFTIISSNYDVLVETRLFATVSSIPDEFDFGFAWREVNADYDSELVHLRPAAPRYRLFKLHGSLNWVRCPMCQLIYLNPVGDIASVAFLEGRHTENTCHCGYSPLQMHIVAPSYARGVTDPNLREIWKASLQALRMADEWVIMGYSLPPEDLAIRSMFTRAYHGRFTGSNVPRPPKITVVQRNHSAEARYRAYFAGPAREHLFQYHANGLAAFLEGQSRAARDAGGTLK